MLDAIKTLIADDHTIVRDGLVAMIGRGGDIVVVGVASKGLEAFDKSLQLRPGVVLMDPRMPEMNGVDAMRRIGDQAPDVKFVVLTTYDDRRVHTRSHRCRVKGLPAEGRLQRGSVRSHPGSP
jgi:DNA-binding NarL/FixJ family response regulator